MTTLARHVARHAARAPKFSPDSLRANLAAQVRWLANAARAQVKARSLRAQPGSAGQVTGLGGWRSETVVVGPPIFVYPVVYSPNLPLSSSLFLPYFSLLEYSTIFVAPLSTCSIRVGRRHSTLFSIAIRIRVLVSSLLSAFRGLSSLIWISI